MILSVCDSSNVLESMKIVKTVINIISYILPVILIISSMMTFTKSVADIKNNPHSKALKTIINRCIAAVIIFLVPIFVGVIVNVSTGDLGYVNCLRDANDEGIAKAKVREAKALVNEAKNTLTSSDYNIAKSAVVSLPKGNDRTALENELKSIEKTVNLYKEINSSYKTGTEEDYERFVREVNKLPSSKAKNDMLSKLKEMKNRIEAAKKIDTEKANQNMSYNNQSKATDNKNITLNYYNASTGQGFSYWLYVPPNASTNLPIVLYIHDLGCRGDDFHNGTDMAIWGGPIREIRRGTKNYNAILVHVQVPENQKSQNYVGAYVELLNKIANSYSANKKKISVMGFSNGCYGIVTLISAYQNYFSAAVPIGCTMSNPSAFKTTPVWTFVGAGDGKSSMPGFVSQVKSLGGEAYHTQCAHSAHNVVYDTNYSMLTEYQVVEWMISKSR